MEVELVPWGRSCLVFALCAPCKDLGMLATCCGFLLLPRKAAALDLTCQRDAGSMLQRKGITSFLL